MGNGGRQEKKHYFSEYIKYGAKLRIPVPYSPALITDPKRPCSFVDNSFHLIRIDYHISKPNSCGGVDVCAAIKNLSDKTIQQCTLYFIPYNSVGDAVRDEITGRDEKEVQLEGSLAPDEKTAGNNETDGYGVRWECLWYNSSIVRAGLSRAEIEYTDGSGVTIHGRRNISGGKSDKACYIATAVYGSYDCPEVWTLRRYRDLCLAQTRYGRAFIRSYYAISPTLVKWFGRTVWFRRFWKSRLDRMTAELKARGFADTPYSDD